MRKSLRRLLGITLIAGIALGAPGAGARSPSSPSESRRPQGRPRIVLDRLVLPAELSQAPALERHLRSALSRETRRADWGAGRGSTITYRFFIEKLSITEEGGVVRVHCTALGKLPKGKVARSRLTFSGAPAERRALVQRVLEIVARGVIGRLAELERIRRGR